MPSVTRHLWPVNAFAAGVLALLLATGTTRAQVPEELRLELIELGQSLAYERTVELYDPLLATAPRGTVLATKDLSYGADARHKLDIYRSEGTSGAPVVVFVHGGGYVGGDRDITEFAYGNIPTYFARHGLLALSATYRLAPEHPWPAGPQDVGRMVAWIKQHAAEYGGNPDRLFLMGHSAGATHVATYAFHARFHPPEGPGVAGVILISGRYRVYPEDADDPRFGNIRAYFGTEPEAYRERSAVTQARSSELPVLLVVAEYDPPDLARTAGELFAELCRREDRRCPRLLRLPYHNHMSEVLHFNTGDEILGREILEFLKEGAAEIY